MDKDSIRLQEKSNDGSSIYLYYDEMAGVYCAYGLSAYYTTMVTEPYMSYSESMEMPVALLRRENILYLRQSLRKIEHTMKHFYRFQTRAQIGYAGYERWAQGILKKHFDVKK